MSGKTSSGGGASGGLPSPVGAYAYARCVGELVFLAGIGPRKPGSKAIPGVRLDQAGNVLDYDIEAQVRQCFANVREALTQNGSSWERIVDVTVFMTDLGRDFAKVNALWSEYFADERTRPCRTTVEVSGLPKAGDAPINFEVKVIATRTV